MTNWVTPAIEYKMSTIYSYTNMYSLARLNNQGFQPIVKPMK